MPIAEGNGIGVIAYRCHACDPQRLSFIRRARDLGFSLSQVRELLSLSDQRRRSCEAVDVIAREHLAEVDRKIADLAALRHELDSIINQCDRGTIAECRIIEALSPTLTIQRHGL